MREDCKHYQSRTYPSGETVRKCNLDLAPEAPWRCPDDCPSYARRLADVDWSHGSLVSPPAPDEPPDLDSEEVIELLEDAEDIVNAAVPEVVADFDAPMGRGWWRRRGRRT